LITDPSASAVASSPGRDAWLRVLTASSARDSSIDSTAPSRRTTSAADSDPTGSSRCRPIRQASACLHVTFASIDPEGTDSTPHSEIVEVPQDNGTIKEFFRRRRLWVRLDYLLSAWAQTPEDEQLLLGLIIRFVMENPELGREKLKGNSFEEDFRLNMIMSARLDEGTLARFWGSLNQPVRPSVQVWTAIPIIPEKLEEFRRVQSRQLEYKSITDPRVSETGPSGNPFLGARRLDLGGGEKK